MTAVGVPDLNGCKSGTEVWVECKGAAAFKVNISAEQVAWLVQRTRAGGHTFVAVRKHQRWRKVDSLYLYAGAQAGQLQLVGLSLEPLGSWPGGPARWDWPQVERLLLA